MSSASAKPLAIKPPPAVVRRCLTKPRIVSFFIRIALRNRGRGRRQIGNLKSEIQNRQVPEHHATHPTRTRKNQWNNWEPLKKENPTRPTCPTSERLQYPANLARNFRRLLHLAQHRLHRHRIGADLHSRRRLAQVHA